MLIFRDKISILNIYYEEDQYLAMERTELYGFFDLLSNFGGLLGLFIGFSLTSVAEILYFLTLRICCNLKLYNRQTGCKADK